MKFAHTFWSKPLIENKFENKINSIKYTLTDYACSAAWIHRCGYEIVLYTDEFGAELLDFIPYDEVIIIDNDEINNSKHFAAKFKFEAMKDMEIGDVLIDGDLIIRSRSTCKMIEENHNDVLYSFFEPHSYTSQGGAKLPYYSKMFNKLNEFTFEEPYKIPSLDNLCWPNTSMLKINNEEIRQEYINQYEKHIGMLNNTDFQDTWPDIIIEQYFLGCLLDNEKYSHGPFIEGFPTNEANEKAVKLCFTHLGACKISHNNVVEKWLKDGNRIIYNDTMKEIKKQTEKVNLGKF